MLTNAMRDPSGDKEALRAWLIRMCVLRPSTDAARMSELPVLVHGYVLNRITSPSGDHAGFSPYAT